MTEKLIKPRRTAAEELSTMIFRAGEKHARVPFLINGQQYATEFFNTEHSLVAAVWSYRQTVYPEDESEILEGAIKFTKDTDEILVKHDGLDQKYDLMLFAEGLTHDRPAEAEDLVRYQP